MRWKLVVSLLAGIVLSAPVGAQQKISPQQLYQTLSDFPVVCLVPEGGGPGCVGIEEYSFLTKSKGLSVSTGLLEIDSRQFLRMRVTAPFSLTNDGLCFTGSQPIKDAHFDIVQNRNYPGSSRGQRLTDSSKDFVEKQILNPMIALFDSSTLCTIIQIPEEREKSNELEYASYLDDEIVERGRVLLYKSRNSSKLKLTPID